MVLDDHDMADDWSISRSWKEEMSHKFWWRERLVGGLMTYWIYQHALATSRTPHGRPHPRFAR